jgi:hypothetical protein
VGPWAGLEQPKKKTKGPGRGGHAKKLGIRQHKPDLTGASQLRGMARQEQQSLRRPSRPFTLHRRLSCAYYSSSLRPARVWRYGSDLI